jgi:DNA primase
VTITADRRELLTAKADSYTEHIDQALPYLEARGICAEAAQMFGLGFVVSGEFAGRLSIPYWTPAGAVAIKYRALDGGKPKYLNEHGTGTHLYNANALLWAGNRVVVTEGELDAVTVQYELDLPAVAYPGTETWLKNPHFRLCFEGIPEVLIIADGDDAGRKAAHRVAEDIGWQARVVPMPEGEDANSFICKEGADAFAKRLDS